MSVDHVVGDIRS